MGINAKRTKKKGGKNNAQSYTQHLNRNMEQQLQGQARAQQGGGLASNARGQIVGEGDDLSPNNIVTPPPGCLSKLTDPLATNRELGCNDAATIILDPSQRVQLFAAKVHVTLLSLLSDPVLNVRAAAASALRNFVQVAEDSFIDELVTSDFLELVGGHLKGLFQQCNEEKQRKDDQQNSGQSNEDDENADVISAGQGLDDWLQFLAVVAEASDKACTSFCSVAAFLHLVMDCLTIPQCQASAAELFNVMSSENEALTNFFTQELSQDQQQFLDNMVSSVPSSPYLVRCAVNMAGTLINCMPTPQNAGKVLPLILAAIEHQPVEGIRKVAQFLSDESQLSAVVQKAGVDQEHDRLRALQAAIDVTSEILNMVMDSAPSSGGGDGDEDDEVTFQRSPLAQPFVQSGILNAVSNLAKSVLPPLEDVVVKQILRAASHNNQISGLQRAFLGVEVGVCSLVSNVMMVLPLNSLGGDVGVMWSTTGNALADRLQRVHESQSSIAGVDHLGDDSNVVFGNNKNGNRDSSSTTAGGEEDDLDNGASFEQRLNDILPSTSVFATPEALSSLLYQVESLVELLWTIQRKDTNGAASAGAGEIDILTRVVWEKDVSISTKVFVVGTVGCIGTKGGSNSPDLNLVCGKMCKNLISRALEAIQNFTNQNGPNAADQLDESEVADMVEVAAEAANVIMDLYSEDWYDASGYIPLELHAVLGNNFLPVLKQALSKLKRKSPKRRHFEEIATNLQAFLQYKQKNVRWQK